MRSEKGIICRFDAYIKKSLTNELRCCIRRFKRESNRYVNFSDLGSLDRDELIKPDRYPSDEFREHLTTRLFDAIIHDELLYEALLTIHPEAREILVLKYWGDMTDSQIGDAMNMSQQRINYKKNVALKKLKTYIEEMKKYE